LFKPKHVGAFIVNLNANFNILKQFKREIVVQIKDLIIVHFLVLHFMFSQRA